MEPAHVTGTPTQVRCGGGVKSAPSNGISLDDSKAVRREPQTRLPPLEREPNIANLVRSRGPLIVCCWRSNYCHEVAINALSHEVLK